MKPEVLVVGAGTTGLTTAIELARRGVKTSVIERRSNVSSMPRAVGITPASLALLNDSGATTALLQSGLRIEHLRICARGTPLLKTRFSQSSIRSNYPFILALPQQRTEQILCRVLERYGVNVWYNTSLQSLNDTRDGVLAVCSDGTARLYRYVVGADGINSTTRAQVDLPFSGSDLEQPWSIADVDVAAWPHQRTLSVALHGNGSMAAMIPLSDKRIRVIANTGGALEAIAGEAEVTHVHQQGEIDVSVRQVATYQKGNVFMAGDAAHCHSPVGGRGMNLGFADAVCLAECIANDSVSSYSTTRYPAAYRTINKTERIRKILGSRSTLNTNAVEASLKLAAKLPLLQRRLVDLLLYA